MNKKEIIDRAQELQRQAGGKLFCFPVQEEEAFSPYAVVMFAGGTWHVFPQGMTIEEAAAGILATIEAMGENGYPMDYERDVRFVSYEAQVNAPSVTMRRLKKESGSYITL